MSMNIFVVDDDPVARLIAVDQLLHSDYAVNEFENAVQLLAAMDQAPDLILLDIEMPGMNGIAACQALRAAGHTQQVIFVSAEDGLDTRLAAYEAGGSDFIIKPYQTEELARKIAVAEHLIAEKNNLSQQARYASQTAFTAMSSMGEMGILIDFFRSSFACSKPEQLAAACLTALGQYDLHGLLELRQGTEQHCYSSKGICTPLEQSILSHASGMDRIFQFSDRMAINYPAITLLALGLPLNDPDRTGRLRDHLAILAEGADARLRAMETEHRQLAQARGIDVAVAELGRALEEVGRRQASNRVQAMEIDGQFLKELTDILVHFGLSDRQETTLTDLVQTTHARINALRDDDNSVADGMSQIIKRLQQLSQG